MKIIAVFIFSFVSIFPIYAQDDLNTPLPGDKKVLTGTLPNGIKYYIRKNSKPENRAELRIAVNAGSTSEDEDQQGLAHFVEHMAFNGSKHFKKNELVDYLESVGTKFGAHLNAYTSFDETVYMIQLPTDSPSIMEKGIQILVDWAQYLSFDSLEIEKERGVVIEEWRLGQGANERMRRKYWPLLFKDSRYAERLPIGKKEILEKCPQSALKRFYNDWYRPDLMAVVAVGDFDPEQMKKKITDAFSELPSRANERKLQVYTVPDNQDMIIATATDKEARYAEVEIIYKQPKESEISVGDYRRGIARQLFSSMLNSRLSELERLADPPYINGSGGYGRLVRNSNAYSLSAICREDGIQMAFNTLLEENERIRRYGFTQSELERQKKEMMRGMEVAFSEREKTESRNFAREYVSNFLNGEPFPGIEFEYELYRKYLGGITLDEINSFAVKWITDGKNCIVLITAPEKESTKMISEEYIKESTGRINAQNISKYVDKVTDKPLLPNIPPARKISTDNVISELEITELSLENGVKVIFKPTNFKNDEIIFTSYSWGGWSVLPKEDFLSASIADAIVDESGTGEIDAVSLEKMLSGKVVSCSPYIGELQHGFKGSCSPADLETLFQLIYSYSVYPRRDTVAFRSVIERRKGILKNRNSDPQSVFSDSVRYAMSGYNYYYRPWTTEMLDSINLDKSLGSYRKLFTEAGSSVYVFIGNFNPISLRYYASIYLGNLPSGNSSSSWKNIGVKYPSGTFERTLKLGQEPKSTVYLRWNMGFDYNRNNRNEVNALNKLVSIRLREILREEKSGVYGVGFNSTPYHFPEEKLEQVVSFSCSPGNVDMLIQSALDVLAEVKEKGSNELNLVKIKETAIRERETYLKENSFWLNTISSNHQNGENIRDIIGFNDWVNGLKPPDFILFAKKYLQTDNYAKFVLMPEN